MSCSVLAYTDFCRNANSRYAYTNGEAARAHTALARRPNRRAIEMPEFLRHRHQ